MTRVRTHLLGAALVALQGAAAATTTAQDATSWAAAWSYGEEAAQTVLGQDYRPRKHTVSLTRGFDAATQALGQHEYRILDLPLVNGVAADTNGHVHRLTFGWQRHIPRWRLQLSAVLAVSSNVLKHLGDASARDLQPDVAVDHNLVGTFWFGLRADDRFGRTFAYPTAAWHIQATPAHELHIGIPDASWRWRWTQTVESRWAVGPDGAVWRVRDRGLDRSSDVRLRAWFAALSVHWQPAAALGVEARAGRRFAGRLRYLLLDGTTAAVDVADGNVFGIALAARF